MIHYVGVVDNGGDVWASASPTFPVASAAAKRLRIEDAGFGSLRSPAGKLAEIFSTPPSRGEENWAGALFAQTELFRILWSLEKGALRIPGEDEIYAVPLCSLSALGELGYDRRDIHDAFEVSTEDWSPFPAFWGHDARRVRTMAQSANARLIARTVAARGRKLRDARTVWSKAGSILLVERLRSNIHQVLAVGFDQPVLGNTWWAFKGRDITPMQAKALLLWLNGSLSLLLYFGRRVTTQGAWMQMKKPAWHSMPVLDVGALTAEQLAALGEAYDDLSTRALSPLAQLDADAARIDIDAALCNALRLPDIRHIRSLLAREPGLSAVEINPRGTISGHPHAPSGFAEEDELEDEAL